MKYWVYFGSIITDVRHKKKRKLKRIFLLNLTTKENQSLLLDNDHDKNDKDLYIYRGVGNLSRNFKVTMKIRNTNKEKKTIRR
jgi:hypothetical protein